MPTGYTAKLHDGTEQSPKEFILRCAHAMGALVLLRDEGSDSPIPEFTPQTKYDDERITAAQTTIRDAELWTTDEAQAASDAEFTERLQSWRDYEAKKDAIRARYEAMVAEVEAWIPPTSDHEGLKKFMLDQLHESIRFDCTPWSFSDSISGGATHLDGESFRTKIIEDARTSIDRARKNRTEEIERTAGRNKWVKELLGSLPAR